LRQWNDLAYKIEHVNLLWNNFMRLTTGLYLMKRLQTKFTWNLGNFRVPVQYFLQLWNSLAYKIEHVNLLWHNFMRLTTGYFFTKVIRACLEGNWVTESIL
jgi:hypothetical protein